MSEPMLADAMEMASVLKSAKCLARHTEISHDRLSEILITLFSEGRLADNNSTGHDVTSTQYGLIEVKSRILGTDGPNPRVTLRKTNIERADWFAAIRWTRDFKLSEAVMLPKAAARELYEPKKQSSGVAHIAWEAWSKHPAGKNIKADLVFLIPTI